MRFIYVEALSYGKAFMCLLIYIGLPLGLVSLLFWFLFPASIFCPVSLCVARNWFLVLWVVPVFSFLSSPWQDQDTPKP